MGLLDISHGGYVHRRRVDVLSREFAKLIPPGSTVLDVGSGDGRLAARIRDRVGDLKIHGIDTLVRPGAHIPIARFDGRVIPHPDASFDYVMFVDVLHHTDDPRILLREASRVARKGVLIKDHLLEGTLAGPILGFMDWVGNARHGVPLPYNYWTRAKWDAAFRELNRVPGYWKRDLGLYPAPADWVFGRSLHFVARLDPASVASLVQVDTPEQCCSSPWEDAYERFETPEQEIGKFATRLRDLGAEDWPRDARIVELFCGRGNGLHALERLGFQRIEGADLSATLLEKYRGPAKCYVADCRSLPFENGSKDIIIVQGGLHHLPALPDDLEKTVAEIVRVLAPGGRVILVEPWLTPFLRFVHFTCEQPVCRRMSGKLDALATMIEHERTTYEAWLSKPQRILDLLKVKFVPEICRIGWGKLMFVGRRKQG